MSDAEEFRSDPTDTVTREVSRDTTVIARTVVRTVVPMILMVAIALLFQGHNYPGGGFIGGVLTATAFVLVYVIYGLEYVREGLLDRPTFDTVGAYRWLFSGGLVLALLSGIAPILGGYPFMTQGVLFIEGLPVYGSLEVASAFVFDLGVYCVVVGAILTVLAEVGAE